MFVSAHTQEDQVQAASVPKTATRCMAMTQVILHLSLFIIGCVAAAGNLNGVVAGGCMIGLSVPLVIVGLQRIISPMGDATAKWERINAGIYLIIPLVMITMGSFVIAGSVSPVVGGWTVVAASGPITVAVLLLVGYGMGCRPCCDMHRDCAAWSTGIQVRMMQARRASSDVHLSHLTPCPCLDKLC
jgi:uncharacterized Tic20 family protein